MKKYIFIISSLFLLNVGTSCSDKELELTDPLADQIDNVDTMAKIHSLLNNAYLTSSSTNLYGTEILAFGDILGDNLYVTNSSPTYKISYNMNYSSTQGEFNFYSGLYNVIMSCNFVINNTKVPNSDELTKAKAEAKMLRAMSYFTLVNYYSPSPTSGINQDYGVPIVLENYDVNVQPERATVAQVYQQIIKDLQEALIEGDSDPKQKLRMSKTAAKLLLAKVFLTRRAPGDAELALQYSTDIVNNSDNTFFEAIDKELDIAPTTASVYNNYFTSTNNDFSENQKETIWELDINQNSVRVNGIGSNLSLPLLYHRQDSKRALLFKKNFYDSFKITDVRRALFTPVGVPDTDDPKGVWTNKYPRYTTEGTYLRNIKILRFSDAILSRIEALHLTGQNAQALIELNQFSKRRKGDIYTGTDILSDILSERAKEFYGEGQRFLDLKRYNQPIVKVSNCVMNCEVSANDKLFVLPLSQGALNSNPKLKQYPGYN